MFRAHDWADREATWRSYELFARWVAPRFQQSLDTIESSYAWCVENRKHHLRPQRRRPEEQAFTDAGREPVPKTGTPAPPAPATPPSSFLPPPLAPPLAE